MYLIKTPSFIPQLFPGIIWKLDVNTKSVCISFDDGPDPISTPLILKWLNELNIKAVFFCLGSQIAKYPELFQEIIAEGHQVGNHGFDHLSGWSTSDIKYFINVRKAGALINSNFFRPPYGRLSISQYQYLKKRYQIVMWDILSGDFDKSINIETRCKRIILNTKPGSILVFHEGEKSIVQLKKMLPYCLNKLVDQGYLFSLIPTPIFAEYEGPNPVVSL